MAELRTILIAKGVRAVNQVLRCAPQAVAATKKLLRTCLREPLASALDAAAHQFATARAGEGREGIRAFLEKRSPAWLVKVEKL